jgi:hypothetical protein
MQFPQKISIIEKMRKSSDGGAVHNAGQFHFTHD